MSNQVECKCKVCKKPFMARIADRRRGWARCCSKSCAAIRRTKSNPPKTRGFSSYQPSEHDEIMATWDECHNPSGQ